MSNAFIKNVLNKSTRDDTDDVCSICLMGFDKNTHYIRCGTCQQPQHAECLKLWFQTPIGRVQVGKDPRCQAADGFKNRLEFIAGSTNARRPLGLPPYPAYSKNRKDPNRAVFTNAELRRQRMLDEALNARRPLGLPPYPAYNENNENNENIYDPNRPVFTNAELRRQRLLDEPAYGNGQNNIRRNNNTNRAKKGGKKARTRKCRS